MLLPGLSTQQAAALRRRGLHTRDQLARRLKKLGPGDPVFAALPMAARAELQYSPVSQILLAGASRLGRKLQECLYLKGGPRVGKSRIVTVGSARRGKPVMKDLDMLLILPDTSKRSAARSTGSNENFLGRIAVREKCRRSVKILTSYANGSRRRSFIIRYGRSTYRVDFFLAFDSERPYALFHHTGSSQYNIRVRAHAKKRGWKLNQYGLFIAQGAPRHKQKRVPGTKKLHTEEELAKFLGITYRTPGDRSR